MASNLRVDTILPSTGTSLGIGTASGTTTVTGTLNAASATITGNLGVGGVLTYEDVTNVDSVGVITARSGINVSNDIKSADDDFFVYSYKGGSNGQVRSGIQFDSTNQRMEFYTATNERLRIETNGNITAYAGNIIIGTAGKGIDYSAQTASGIAGVTVTSEIFVHYEQGTFTPFLSAASSAPSVSYGAERGGRYTRIGNMVFYSLGLQINSYSGGSGAAYIGGFPYIGAGNPGWDGAHVFRDTAAIGLNSRTNTVGGWIGDTAVAGYPVFYIQSMSNTNNFAAAAVSANSMTTGRLTLHGQYHIG